MKRYLAWFSCGAASAVAAKKTVEKYGAQCEVLYCDTMATEHPDNRRFFEDVQRWLERPIKVLKSSRYATIDDVFMQRRYMSGPRGALCTTELKKFPREAYQRPDDTHVFGYTREEQKRADDFEERNPTLAVEWVLIDAGISKEDCGRILADAGIKLPQLYALGFEHNNCLGCVKSTSAGYWNRVRRTFPEVFARRVQQSRALGVRLVETNPAYVPAVAGKYKVNSKGRIKIFLDELPVDLDAPDDDIDCGPVCQIAREDE